MLGGKGGIGKTLIIRTLYYHLIQAQVKVLGYDTDNENPEFQYHHRNSPHPVTEIDFGKFKGGMEFVNEIFKEQPNVALMDSSAASSSTMRERFEEFEILEAVQDWGYQVTILAVLNSGHSSVESLKRMLDHCQDRANYVVVLNNYFSDEGFEHWNNSEVRLNIFQGNCVEIGFPVLDLGICKILEGEDKCSRIPLFGYQERFKDRPGIQLPIRSFLNRSRSELVSAAKYLGLPAPDPAPIPTSSHNG
jgi:hypothetical protein